MQVIYKIMHIKIGKSCQKAPSDIKEKMYETFSAELKDLFAKDLVSLFGCGIVRYAKYKKISKM